MQSLSNNRPVVIDFTHAKLSDISKNDHNFGTDVTAKLTNADKTHSITRTVPMLYVGDGATTTLHDEAGNKVELNQERSEGWRNIVEQLNNVVRGLPR